MISPPFYERFGSGLFAALISIACHAGLFFAFMQYGAQFPAINKAETLPSLQAFIIVNANRGEADPHLSIPPSVPIQSSSSLSPGSVAKVTAKPAMNAPNPVANPDINESKLATAGPAKEKSDLNASSEDQSARTSQLASQQVVSSEAQSGSAAQATPVNSATPDVAKPEKSREPQPTQSAKPDYAYNPQPDYPLLLREQGVGGIVWVRVWVDTNGKPLEIKLAKGSGYRLLDDAALRAVRSWRFVPAKSGETALASWVEFPIRFTLNG